MSGLCLDITLRRNFPNSHLHPRFSGWQPFLTSIAGEGVNFKAPRMDLRHEIIEFIKFTTMGKSRQT